MQSILVLCFVKIKRMSDMLKQLRTLYTKSNNNILTFSHCTINVNVLINFFILWMCDLIVSTYRKLRAAFNNVYRQLLGLSYKSSASTMDAMHNTSNNRDVLLRKCIDEFMVHHADLIFWGFGTLNCIYRHPLTYNYVYAFPLSHCKLFTTIFIYIKADQLH